MNLLFVTQKLKDQDAFGALWVEEFRRQGCAVTVICLEGSDSTFPFPVHSLKKEAGASRLQSILRFERLILTLPYDRVFIHMAPVWYALGFWVWLLRRTPVYLWYTHYRMQLGVRLFGWFGTRFFCASPQSLPQYEGSEKKVVTGHGIDLRFWPQRANTCSNPRHLLVVHRLSRSKRLELSIRAMPLLPGYTLDIYGTEAEPEYAMSMKVLAASLKLQDRVFFHGTVPMTDLPAIYSSHRLMLNMATDTIDKTMLEALTCGCYPVVTRENAHAIGLPIAPENDTSEAIAAFVHRHTDIPPIAHDAMYEVAKAHGLERLVRLMGEYIREGV